MHRCFAPLYRSYFKYAAVAQLVERRPSKSDVCEFESRLPLHRGQRANVRQSQCQKTS